MKEDKNKYLEKWKYYIIKKQFNKHFGEHMKEFEGVLDGFEPSYRVEIKMIFEFEILEENAILQ